jgi:CrcB protein
VPVSDGILAITVALCGGSGAALRLLVDSAISRRWPREVAIETAVINVVGSFLAGIVVGCALTHGLSPTLRAIVVTGFCGGLTTWSTAMFEVVRLFESKRFALALGFGVGGFAASVGAAAVGLVIVGA